MVTTNTVSREFEGRIGRGHQTSLSQVWSCRIQAMLEANKLETRCVVEEPI